MIKSLITYRDMDPAPQVEGTIERLEAKLKRILRSNGDRAVSVLRVVVQRGPHRIYRVGYGLRIPRRSFHVSAENHDLDLALAEANDELLEAVRRYKDRRAARRRAAEPALTMAAEALGGPESSRPPRAQAVAEVTDRLDVNEILEEEMSRVMDYLRRRIIGADLATGAEAESLAAALFDDTVARCLSRFEVRPRDVPFRLWLVQLADEVFEERRQRQPQGDRYVSFEGSPIRVLADRVATTIDERAEEMLEFFQPDAWMKTEDLIETDHSLSPEDLVTGLELEELLLARLDAMGEKERDILMLANLDDFTPEQIAALRQMDVREVRRILAESTELLRSYYDVESRRIRAE